MASISIELSLNAALGVSVPGGATVPLLSNPHQAVALGVGTQFHAKPGETLSGFLVVNAGPTKDLVLNGKGIEFYLRGSDETSITIKLGNQHHREQTHVGGTEIVKEVVQLYASGGKDRIFPAGSVTKFPYSFVIPSPTIPSCDMSCDWEGDGEDEERAQGCGGCCGGWCSCCCCKSSEAGQKINRATVKVKYEIRAKAYVSGLLTSNLVAQTNITIDPVFPIAPRAESMTSGANVTQEKREAHFLSECFGYRALNVTASINKLSFTNGEVIPIQLSIKNGLKRPLDSMIIALQNEVDVRVRPGLLNPIASVRRYITCHRQTFPLQIEATSSQNITQLFTMLNMRPDMKSGAFNSKTVLLIRMHVMGEQRYLNLRIPLHAPYQAVIGAGGVVMSPQNQQPMLVSPVQGYHHQPQQLQQVHPQQMQYQQVQPQHQQMHQHPHHQQPQQQYSPQQQQQQQYQQPPMMNPHAQHQQPHQQQQVQMYSPQHPQQHQQQQPMYNPQSTNDPPPQQHLQQAQQNPSAPPDQYASQQQQYGSQQHQQPPQSAPYANHIYSPPPPAYEEGHTS